MQKIAVMFCAIWLAAATHAQTADPEFGKYPAEKVLKAGAEPATPILKPEDEWKYTFRTRIRAGAASGVNFAGTYNLISFGCGTGCTIAFVADLISGDVIEFPYGGEDYHRLRLYYTKDSRLLRAVWMNGDFETCTQHDMLFDGAEFSVLSDTKIAMSDYC